MSLDLRKTSFLLSNDEEPVCIYATEDHLFSIEVKFSEKLTFLTPWYAHICVRIRG